MLNSHLIKKNAREYGADLVGIAPVARFSGVSADQDPRQIKPDTKSIIVMGFRYLRGSLRGIENGSNWGTLTGADPVGMSSYLQETTYHFCCFLEENGYEATPLIRSSYDLRNRGVSVAPGRAMPDVIIDMEYAAFASGLGELGLGKLFLTPEFGPCQVFSAVLTELELEPDPVFSGSLCDQCGECVRACPAVALDTGSVVAEKRLAGTLRHYALRVESCQICSTGTIPRPYALGLEPNRMAANCGRACHKHLLAMNKISGRAQKE